MTSLPTDAPPTVAVVIPTFNEERGISACLDAVLAQSYRSLDVLVVDGGSTDRTRDVVAAYTELDPRVRFVHNPRRTQPAALNTAVEHIDAPYMVRIDAHSTVPSDYVERIVAHLATGKWGGVGGRKDGVATSEQGRAICAALGSRFGVGNSTYHHGTRVQVVDHIPFGAYPLDVVRELGGWNESTPSQEDFEFDYRVRTSGRELLFDPKIVILWQTRERVFDLFQQYRRYGRGKSCVLRLHPESASPRHVLPAAVVGYVALGLLLLPLRPKWGLALLASYGAGLTFAGAVTAPAAPLGRGRRYLPAAFGAMHLGYGLGLWETTVLGTRPDAPMRGRGGSGAR